MDEIEAFPINITNSPAIEEISELQTNKKNRRPPNAYILFCLEKRGTLREKFPDIPNIEISRMLGEQWKSLDESVKLPYKEKAKEMQKQFKVTNPEYKYERARKRRQEQEDMLQKSRSTIPELFSNFPPHLLNTVLLTYLTQLNEKRETRTQQTSSNVYSLQPPQNIPQSPDSYFNMFEDPNQ